MGTHVIIIARTMRRTAARHTPHLTTAPAADRTAALQLAAVAGCDVRTAARALREGPDAIRGPHRIREAIRAALRDARTP